MDQLTYIGHATALLRLDGVAILTDPMLRDWLGPLRRQAPSPDPLIAKAADLVLISHLHRDHLDLQSLKQVPADTPVVVPRGAAGLASKGGAQDVRELGSGRPSRSARSSSQECEPSTAATATVTEAPR